MSRNSNHQGIYVRVRCEGDGPVSFKWSIHRRSTPLVVKLTEGGFTSFHAAQVAGSKVSQASLQLLTTLKELVQNLLKEEDGRA